MQQQRQRGALPNSSLTNTLTYWPTHRHRTLRLLLRVLSRWLLLSLPVCALQNPLRILLWCPRTLAPPQPAQRRQTCPGPRHGGASGASGCAHPLCPRSASKDHLRRAPEAGAAAADVVLGAQGPCDQAPCQPSCPLPAAAAGAGAAAADDVGLGASTLQTEPAVAVAVGGLGQGRGSAAAGPTQLQSEAEPLSHLLLPLLLLLLLLQAKQPQLRPRLKLQGLWLCCAAGGGRVTRGARGGDAAARALAHSSTEGGHGAAWRHRYGVSVEGGPGRTHVRQGGSHAVAGLLLVVVRHICLAAGRAKAARAASAARAAGCQSGPPVAQGHPWRSPPEQS
eukprot:774936-Pelagomonas_calceolata.AAC.2